MAGVGWARTELKGEVGKPGIIPGRVFSEEQSMGLRFGCDLGARSGIICRVLFGNSQRAQASGTQPGKSLVPINSIKVSFEHSPISNVTIQRSLKVSKPFFLRPHPCATARTLSLHS